MIYPYVRVIITHKGEQLSKEYYDEHPEIHHLYPSQNVFQNKLYLPLLEKVNSTNQTQTLEISENLVKVNGQTINI